MATVTITHHSGKIDRKGVDTPIDMYAYVGATALDLGGEVEWMHSHSGEIVSPDGAHILATIDVDES